MSAAPPTPQTQADAERTARHMRLCREMAELAADLARAAAARAKQHLATPEPAATQPEDPTTQPAPRGKAPDPSILFTRLCRIVHVAIALEARLAAGLIPDAPKTPAWPTAAKPKVAMPQKPTPILPQPTEAEAATSAARLSALIASAKPEHPTARQALAATTSMATQTAPALPAQSGTRAHNRENSSALPPRPG